MAEDKKIKKDKKTYFNKDEMNQISELNKNTFYPEKKKLENYTNTSYISKPALNLQKNIDLLSSISKRFMDTSYISKLALDVQKNAGLLNDIDKKSLVWKNSITPYQIRLDKNIPLKEEKLSNEIDKLNIWIKKVEKNLQKNIEENNIRITQIIKDIEKNNSELNAKVEVTKTDIETTRADIETTKTNIEATRIDIETAKTDIETAKDELNSIKSNLFSFFGLIVGLLAFVFTNMQFIDSASDLGLGKMIIFMGLSNTGLIIGIILILKLLGDILDLNGKEKNKNDLKTCIKKALTPIVIALSIVVFGIGVDSLYEKPSEMRAISQEELNKINADFEQFNLINSEEIRISKDELEKLINAQVKEELKKLAK